MSVISETEKKILDAFYAPVPSGPGDRAVLQKVINAVTVAGDEEILRLRAKVEQLEREAVEHRAQIQRAQDTVLETLEDLNAALAKNESLQEALRPFAKPALDRRAEDIRVMFGVQASDLQRAYELLNGETK